jgi:hypothetical protein
MNNLEEELKDLEDQLSKEKNTVNRAVLSDKIRLKKQEIKEAAEEVKETVVITKKDDPVRADHIQRKDIRRGEIMGTSTGVGNVII